MKCRSCQQEKMCCVDDNGGLGGGVWEHYICPICLTEFDYVKKGKHIKEEWTLNDDFIIREKEELIGLYRNEDKEEGE